jgi:hypothetical protein
MTKNKSLDIVIPYWGEFALLKEAVDSVLAQTSDDWHLTILDDHYPSTEAHDYYTKLADPRITYIRHKKNLGITNNFNFAVQHVTAPHCMIMGCDDRLLPECVAVALQTIGEADFYQPGVQVINDKGQLYLPLVDRVKRFLQPHKSGLYSGEKLATSLSHGDWLYFPSIVWKTATLKRYSFDATYTILEDLVLVFDFILDGAVLAFDQTETFQYRRFAQSLSSKEKSKDGVRFAEENEVYTSYAQRFASVGWCKAARAARLHITSRIHQLLS